MLMDTAIGQLPYELVEVNEDQKKRFLFDFINVLKDRTSIVE